MVFKKNKSIKLSKYFEIKRAEYTTVQLIPTKSNKNNTTSNIALLINKMFLNLSDIVRLENKKLVITANMKASYYIHITKEETQFFFIVPTIHLNTFKTKFAATWRNVEIKEVDGLPIDINEYSKYQLRYKYNDILSLDVDKRSNDLLNANMSILEVLESKESVGILYNFIPTGERAINYFRVLYKDMIQRYKNGENLKKNKNVWDLFIMAVKFVLGVVDDLLGSLNKEVTQKRVMGIKKKISNSTERKYDKDICKTQIIVVAKSYNKEKEKNLCRNMCSTFKSISDDNELNYKKIKKDINIKQVQINNVAINNTSIDECNNFLALPGAELINQYKNIKHNNTKENPVPEELTTGICNLGSIKYKDKNDQVYLNNDEELKSLPHAILGGSRSGKSILSINICKNIIDAGEGLIVPDFIKNCEFTDIIKAITPKHRLIDVDLSIYSCIQALAYNELMITKDMKPYEINKITRRKTSMMLELVNIMNNDEKQLPPKMRKYLGAAARVAFCFNNSSMRDVMRILQVHEARYTFINKLSNDLKVLLEDSIISLNELDEWSKVTKDNPVSEVVGTKENKIEGIIDRIDFFRENDVIDAMFSKDPSQNIDLIKAMDEGKIIIIRMRDKDFDDKTSKDVLTTFFMQKIWLATKIRGSRENKSKYPARVTLLIDEVFQVPTAQKILTDTFLQSAKFGLKYMLTLHNLDGLSKEALASLKGANTSYTLISGVDKKAFEELEKEFEVHGYSLDDLLNLKRFDALHLLKGNDGYKALITHLPPELKVESITESKIQNIA
ncbi:AAA-like domain [uncultured Clostridium sp.]|nr:AAA-like domain [uncultured Clostridium sp.]